MMAQKEYLLMNNEHEEHEGLGKNFKMHLQRRCLDGLIGQP